MQLPNPRKTLAVQTNLVVTGICDSKQFSSTTSLQFETFLEVEICQLRDTLLSEIKSFNYLHEITCKC